MTQQEQPTSFARILITPIILLVAGYLIAGLAGALIAGVIGIVYILWASRRGRGPKTSSREENLRTLSQLAELRRQGAITDQEYETKKVELLGKVQ